ncbi:bifunctional diaminohydroxyphosphoribosylaminopyrimidine deaminase/5-amino-6-(5-phosphoribosylamino)uracil reductase RibD [Leeia sp. TBRC 13508]|uniref:Riboflavin biosynthesis protein RibD n=1 Tax=Leeia speluncae TaxID=2884804 RepID=A0ABS8D2M9_9NEIS|nr:bifunctional diaminohydroxyphosphoribosylaminopyrimidine deaminase/5-amino-6-(5-phosphoribosylamino)uracil reductase RibD [Leeia speluncae]MCB6182447.1 bifunctional diaminohydroxyphosphoribosylaminopyrimidine deaminase/5-amino-6-(5-phosphoribosylamino)uracil reductase RibD [Leeia speluncae]
MPEVTAADIAWMQEALAEADKGIYITTPNPSVGCVLVKEGEVVGRGHTQPAGQAHAEVMALRSAGALSVGATAYVTLEPCSHFGRTPPCADALIRAGISRLVVAALDPNPLVSGQGLDRIKAAGIEVVTGVLADAATYQLRGFLSRMTRHRPWLRLKIAASLDGKTALANGDSKWITGNASRSDVQHWRARSCAMVTGIGTVIADDPQLNVRILNGEDWHGRQPVTVILDTDLKISPNAKILKNPQVVVLTANTAQLQTIASDHIQVVVLPREGHHLSMRAVLDFLSSQSWNEVTVEAGAILNAAFLDSGMVDEIILYQAPKLLGTGGREMIASKPLQNLASATTFVVKDCQPVGEDMRWILHTQPKPSALVQTEVE